MNGLARWFQERTSRGLKLVILISPTLFNYKNVTEIMISSVIYTIIIFKGPVNKIMVTKQ